MVEKAVHTLGRTGAAGSLSLTASAGSTACDSMMTPNITKPALGYSRGLQ